MQNLYLGLEFGSTRIKAVLISEENKAIAQGDKEWANHFENGFWTYHQDEILNGLTDCVQSLFDNLKETDIKIRSIGISAMMHGYLAFDKDGNLLVPFRTWRNACTKEASLKLSELFGYTVQERWSIAHLYQAILNKEEHVKDIAYITTLSGYIHYLLTGKKVLGIGDASGMFPIDPKSKDYDQGMVDKFDKILKDNGLSYRLKDILPQVLEAGTSAGSLTLGGLSYLPKNDLLREGIPFCPPEGDGSTGMVATNSIRPYVGNLSAGTSAFMTVVLEHKLPSPHYAIAEMVTPNARPICLIYSSNCNSDLERWVSIIQNAAKLTGHNVSRGVIYDYFFSESQKADYKANDLISYNFLSAEPILGLKGGRTRLVNLSGERITLPNLLKSQIRGTITCLAFGKKMLDEDGVKIESINGHGGLFKSKDIVGPIYAEAMNSQVIVKESASEGGPYGMALLAKYLWKKEMTLEHYLDEIFKDDEISSYRPTKEGRKEFEDYLTKCQENLSRNN